MRMETGGAGIGKLKGRKTRDKVFAHGSGASRGPGKECGEEIQNAVAGALASASWRRDVGLSDCTVGGGAGRRPWNFHVNKISVRKSVRCLSCARERRWTQKGKGEGRGRKAGGRVEERDVRYTFASPHASTHPQRRDSPDGYDVTTCATPCVYTHSVVYTAVYKATRRFHVAARRRRCN